MCKYTFVNKETCIGCGTCGEIASNLFDYDEAGLAFAILDDNTGTIPVPEGFMTISKMHMNHVRLTPSK